MILWQFSSTNSERWLSERICFASCLRKTYKILAEIPFQVVLSTEVLSERLLFVTLFMAVACCLQIVHLLAIVRDGAFWEGWLVAFLLAGAVNRGGADAVERSRKGPHCPVPTLLSSLCKCNQSVTRCDFKHTHIWLTLSWTDISPKVVSFFFNFSGCFWVLLAFSHLPHLIFLVNHVSRSQLN